MGRDGADPTLNPNAAPPTASRLGRSPLWWRAGGALLLAVATLAVFAPALGFGTVAFDDPLYLPPIVKHGLTPAGVRWALTTFYAWNWHPLTWLSLMTDFQLFGQDPRYLHCTNIALHVANVLLLFAILGWSTRAWGKSFFVAALFGIHPLHVESVAWIAERKDVLSTFFGFLAIGAYIFYARRPSWFRYAVTFGLFALSLLAKPMLVTLPCLLLLLDVWPLRRLPWPFGESTASERGLPGFAAWLRQATPKLLEKVPLLALSLVSSVLTYMAQDSKGAVINIIPAPLRILNMFMAYVGYLKKALLPIHLAAMYPYHLPLAFSSAVACALILLLFTVAAVRLGRRAPYLPVGWFWYLGTLVPVIGIVQAGSQTMADRYTYVPLIGAFIIAVWGLDGLRARLHFPRQALTVFGVAMLIALGVLAHRQVMFWKNTKTLFNHTIAVAGGSSQAYVGLGAVELQQNNLEAAARDFRKATLYYPPNYAPYVAVGQVAFLRHRWEEAEHALQKATHLAPTRPDAYVWLGAVYLRTDRLAQAVETLEHAFRLAPHYPHLKGFLAEARAKQAQKDRASPPAP